MARATANVMQDDVGCGGVVHVCMGKVLSFKLCTGKMGPGKVRYLTNGLLKGVKVIVWGA